MNPCDHCPIDDKIFECCGRHPETGEVAVLSMTRNQRRIVCPNLSESGKCGIYTHRPFACQVHYCNGYQGINCMAVRFRDMQE